MNIRKKILQTAGAGILLALLSAGAQAGNIPLANPGFDDDDVSGGDVFGSAGWSTFGSGFTASSLFDSGNTPLADSPDNVFKAFGDGGGATQTFAATAGNTFSMSGLGQNFVGDALVDPGVLGLQIVFRDKNGDPAGKAADGNFALGFNAFNSNTVDWTNSTDNIWTVLGVGTAPAPDNTVTVDFNVLVLAPTGGAGFFDTIEANQNGHTASICHNGSTYDEGTMMETPISFVITIAGRRIAKAVDKHVANHGDLETYEEGGKGEECKLLDDGNTIDCKVVTLCGPVADAP